MENFLAENQKLRCALLTKCDFNVAKADEAYKFIMGGENPAPAPQAEAYPDGIYIVDGKGKAVLYTGPETKWQHCAGIGIKKGSKSLLVGLTDAADTATQNCIDDLREILNPSIKMDEKQYIPSLGQLYFILCHLKAVNEALAFVGGQPIEVDAWYWSSTSYSANYAWFLYLTNGYAYANAKAAHQIRVRPVSAFF